MSGTDHRLGPHRVPKIDCGKCGAEHHYDARNSYCRECGGFLREATEAEHEQFTEFLVWNSRHLDAERDRDD